MPYKADPTWESKRLVAGLIAVAAAVATAYGIDIDEAFLTDVVIAVSMAVTAVLAVWSKIKERKKVDDADK